MQVVYDGSRGELSLAPAWGGLTFPPGEEVEVPDELGARLVEQPAFRAVKRRRRSSEEPTDSE